MIFKFLNRYRNSILWAITICLLCLTPSSGYPKVSIPHIDKLIHFCMYACFAALLVSESNSLRAKGDVTLKAKLVGLTVAIVFGGIIELLQGTTLIGRGCSLADFIANSTGATAAILLYKFFNTKLKGLI